MNRHSATISWEKGNARFLDGRYNRAHTWTFDGGIVIRGSSSPASVPVPYSDPTAVDPEEAFIAALASCHMLWFLSIAAERGFCVHSYRDAADGVMGPNPHGKLYLQSVTLRPHVVFVPPGAAPSDQEVRALHKKAHDECFLANSVITQLTTEPTFEVLP
jgi:organic hydroperoxide reductase OsmC/OhrA